MVTIGEAVSRLRNIIKAVKQDADMTDRFIYSLIMKHGKLLMRRQDALNKILKLVSLFQTLPVVELIEVDKIESECFGISSGCKIKRTKDKLPPMIDGYWGPFIKTVSSLDYSVKLDPIHPSQYEKIRSQKTFKYNPQKYYWFLNDYLYFPDLEWDAVRVEALFEGDVSKYNCDVTDDCKYIQEYNISIPEYLFTEIDQLALQDLGLSLKIPQDQQHDNKHILAK